MSATNLNKLTNELKIQATAQSIANTLPSWTNNVAPAVTDAAPLNEMERVADAVAATLGLSYAPTTWLGGWIPARNASNLNKLEAQAVANRTAIDSPPPSEVLWTTDAYQTGDLSLWHGQQEVSADRITCVTPPAEVGGGPRNRAFLGRSRIVSGDPPLFGSGNNRAELTRGTSDAPFNDGSITFEGHTTQGSEIWLAFEIYFGNPATVSDANAYRPATSGSWNHFVQWHQRGGLVTQPLSLGVSSSGGVPTVFNCWTRGGPEATAPTSLIVWDLGAFTYGWHQIKWNVRFGQEGVGRSKVWRNGVVVLNQTTPCGFNPDSTGSYSNYLKAGCYRQASLNNSTVYHGGIRAGTTEAAVA